MVKVTVIAYAAGHINVDRRNGLLVVGDDRLGETGVGHHHQVVAPGAYAGAPPTNLHHVPGHTALKFYVVSGGDDALGHNVGTGEQVGQSRLNRQGYGQASQTKTGDQGADVDVHHIQNQQRADAVDYHAAHPAYQREESEIDHMVGAGGQRREIPVDGAGEQADHHQYANDHANGAGNSVGSSLLPACQVQSDRQAEVDAQRHDSQRERPTDRLHQAGVQVSGGPLGEF